MGIHRQLSAAPLERQYLIRPPGLYSQNGENVEILPDGPELVTASEVADYVFCRHSWYLRRLGTSVSEQAQASMNAGVDWQDRKDSVIPVAIERHVRAKRASTMAWTAALFLMTGMMLWELYSLLHR
jgi:hypothetical protein